jgi:hypothetical protein
MLMHLSPNAFRLTIAAALLTGLSGASNGQARPTPKAEAAKVQEAAVLKDAYILMAMGDHDYNGHRAKAMKQTEEAIKILDHSIMKDGTKGEKIVAAKEEIAAAREAFIAKHQGKLHEAQAISDAQMREAGKLLVKAHEALTQKKHSKVREHVNAAIKDVEAALKTR